MIATIAVVCTIVLSAAPRRGAHREALIAAGTGYFALIGLGFMFAEIRCCQYFSIFLGHPIYAMGVCLFSLILSTGLGSLSSGRWPIDTPARIAPWGCLSVVPDRHSGALPGIFAQTTATGARSRIAIALAVDHARRLAHGISHSQPACTGRTGRSRADAVVLGHQRRDRRARIGRGGDAGMAFGINVTMARGDLLPVAHPHCPPAAGTPTGGQAG